MRKLTSTMVLGALLLASPAVAQPTGDAPPQVLPPEKLDLHGDASAPDLSGVWVRVPTTTAAGKSPEGYMPWPPPLKEPYAATWNNRVADGAAGTRTDDPVMGCQPAGMPRFIAGMNGPMLIIQTPGRVMFYRDGLPVRRVWLDGRPMPSAKDIEAFSNGNAMGHYVGSDLVTEVAGIRDQPVDATGVPHSDSLRITERLHRVDSNTLKVEVTLTDPLAYKAPLLTTVLYRKSDDPRWEPHEFLCKPKTDYHPEIMVR